MTSEVGFYHCTRAPAAEVAVRLAARAHAGGARMLLLAEEAALEHLDRLLWTADPESFLPHAIAGRQDDAMQPLLLAPHGAAPLAAAGNGARFLLLLETGLPAGFEGYARVFNLFADGGSAHHQARADWKALAGRDDVQRSYWQQREEGGWQRRD